MGEGGGELTDRHRLNKQRGGAVLIDRQQHRLHKQRHTDRQTEIRPQSNVALGEANFHPKTDYFQSRYTLTLDTCRGHCSSSPPAKVNPHGFPPRRITSKGRRSARGENFSNSSNSVIESMLKSCKPAKSHGPRGPLCRSRRRCHILAPRVLTACIPKLTGDGSLLR